jgi:hypothetical protein
MSKKFDLDKIAKELRAASATFETEGDSLASVQARGTETEIAFTLWQYGEHNRETDHCRFSIAFGAIIGSCLRNYLEGFPPLLRDHQADHFFSSLQAVLFDENTHVAAHADFDQKPGKSDLH